jgi:uncharacterized tellurite resistance protein B-like protein
MKKFLGNIFGDSPEEAAKPSNHDLAVATAALLLEIANVDDEFSDEELAEIVDTLRSYFKLTTEEGEAILEATREELEKRIDMYYFTNRINEHFEKDEKIKIIEMIWRVIYTDKHLHGHEDYLVHRFAKLLRLQHSQMIDAKLRVKAELEDT